MRIAVTTDPEIPVPPVTYGGIERIVELVVRGLIGRGHQVTLFANSESSVRCNLVPYPRRSNCGWSTAARNSAQIVRVIATGKYDLIHSFGRLAYLLPLMPLPIPKLMSYQRQIHPRSVTWGHRISRGTLQFSACSRWMIRNVQQVGCWHVVYNAVGGDQYTFQPRVEPDAPLVFLGRVAHIKGAHVAIEVAKLSGRSLIIAGNIPDHPEHRTYFERHVRPHLDGNSVRYVGPVDNTQKNALLGSAAALLMPVLWEEPFGIVMAEALACGTPVLGFRRGAVPEVIENGQNGFVGDDVDQLVRSVAKLTEIDRSVCRHSMEQRFSSEVMVSEYLRIYGAMTLRESRAA